MTDPNPCVLRLPSSVLQCAANFSEGRRVEVIERIADAVRAVEGAVLADYSWDRDHNRSVMTILGGPEPIRLAVLEAARVALDAIDLRHHTGAHPRAGAVDVVPLVPLRAASMEECIVLSHRIAEDLSRDLKLPVYLYERSAGPGRRVELPEIREGGFEGLFTEPLTGPRAPDFGPGQPHPTAGIAVVGARDPLVAYNINLGAPDSAAARRIAARIRSDRSAVPELSGVRALGLLLESRALAQVSMNLTRPALTPLPGVFDYVREQAEREGIQVCESEVIGLIPRASLGEEPPELIFWRDFRPTQIIEYWLESSTP